MNHQYHPKGGYVDRTKGLHTAQSIVQHKRDPMVSLLTVKPLAVWGGTRGIPKTVLVEKWCFRKYEDLLGVCGHFSATVKLPIPGVGRDLRMSGSYPQGEGGGRAEIHTKTTQVGKRKQNLRRGSTSVCKSGAQEYCNGTWEFIVRRGLALPQGKARVSRDTRPLPAQ